MKSRILFYIIGIAALFFGCEEDIKGPFVKSGAIPDPPTNIRVENSRGSAKISYNLPDDNDLLYVIAIYSSKLGEEKIVKSSVYKNYVNLEGFGESKEYSVTLYSVNRSENRSVPVYTTIKPLPAVIKDVFGTLKTQSAFGGINIKFSNATEGEYVVYTLVKDTINGGWIEYDRLYTAAKEQNYSVRGFNSKPTDFAVYLVDKWKNHSDTLFTKITPLFEELFDKSLWKDAKLADDSNVPRYGALSQLWTSGATAYFFMKQDMPGLKLPNWFTIDLGKKYIFGRMHVENVNHATNWMYQQGTPKKFEIWGSNLASTNWNDWTLLGEFECIKPSGTPVGTLTSEDKAKIMLGDDYDFPIQANSFRYVRFKTLSTFGGNPDVMLLELTLYGQHVD